MGHQPKPPTGRPAQIADLAEAFHAAGRCTAESSNAFDEARRRFEASWNRESGEHPINDADEVQRVTKSLGAQSLQLPKIGVDLETIAATLAPAQRTGAVLISQLEGQLQELDDEIGRGLELEKNPHLTAAQKTSLDAQIAGLEQHAIDDTKSALGQLESLRNGYSDYLQKALANLHADGYDQSLLQQVDADTRVPPQGSNTDEVHKWWTSLTPEQRQRLIAEHPDQIGNLNGVPISARSSANMAVMNQDLNRVRDIASRNGVSVDDVVRDPGKYGLSATDITRYQNANETKQGLDHDAGDPLHPNPVYLFAYDPTAFGGKGRAAVAIGNPDTAEEHRGDRARNQQQRQRRLAARQPQRRAQSVRTIQRRRPEQPDGSHCVDGLRRPQRLQRRPADLHTGARSNRRPGLGPRRQRSVVHAPRRRRTCDGDRSLLRFNDRGRRFCRYGMHANDAVLIGCPGTDLAHNAASFHLDGGHVYVGDASTDPVGMLGELNGASQQIFGGDWAASCSAGIPDSGLTLPQTDSDRFDSARKSPAPTALTPTTIPTTTTAAAKRCRAWPTSAQATATRSKPTA